MVDTSALFFNNPSPSPCGMRLASVLVDETQVILQRFRTQSCQADTG